MATAGLEPKKYVLAKRTVLKLNTKNMRILLINPKTEFLTEDGSRPPLGIAYIASYIENKELAKVDLCDLSRTPLPEKLDYDYIGISIVTPLYNEAVRLSKELRSKTKAKLIAGGPHASASPKTLTKYLDHVIVGEGETGMEQLLTKKSRKVIYSQSTSNIDSIPYPAWDKLPMKDYTLHIHGEKAGTIITSRSCPFSCCYCSKSVYGRTWKANSPEYIIGMIEELHYVYGYSMFYFLDDTFTMNKDRVFKLCDLIEQLPFKIKFRLTTRCDCVNYQMLRRLKEVGLDLISVGVESGNDKILELAGKGMNVDLYKRTFQMFHELEIPCKAFFIIGLPGDTRETVMETIKLAGELNPETADFYPLVAFPGTQVWDNPTFFKIKVDKGFHYYQAGKQQRGNGNVETEKLNRKEIDKLVVYAKNNWRRK